MDDMKLDIIWHDRKRTIFGLPLSFTKYSLTTERLFIETGFLNSVENEMRLYRVLDIELKRSFFQKIFGLGTIAICSADKSLPNPSLHNIKRPKFVKELLSKYVEIQRDAKRVVNRELMMGSDVDIDADGDGVMD